MQALIYWTKVKPLTEEQEMQWIQKLPAEKQQRICNMKDPMRRAASLTAEQLLALGLRQYGVDAEKTERTLTSQGKPMFAKGGIHFSLSHSGEFALAAVAKVPIGADIQLCRPAEYPALAARMFTPEEVTYMQNASDMQRAFYRIWVCKESMGKCFGSGLHSGLPTVLKDGKIADNFVVAEEEDLCIGAYADASLQWQIKYIKSSEIG